MTREEAKRRLLDIERCTPIHTREDARDFEALEMAIQALENHDTFMKYAYSQGKQDALSQEPCSVLNEIQAEIYETFMTIDGGVHDKSALKCMEIIDKYKAESEGKG